MSDAQVAVVGGGPAGLSAALAAARAGAGVVLFDENPSFGGQLRYRIADLPPLEFPPRLAEKLIAEARNAGVELRPQTVVWGLFPGGVLAVSEGIDSYQIRADQIVLATGSTDLPFTFPGGSLPGVMTARGLQILLHVQRVLPARHFAVVGAGPEAVEVRRDIELADGRVVVQVDPECDGSSLAAEGEDAVQAMDIAGDRHEVDAVVIAIGRQPDNELAQMVACEAGFSAELGGFVPLRDANLRTSVPGILVAGDAAGICDAGMAIAEGRFAGLSAAAALGLVSDGTLDA
ncbi:MAG TPA: FAD-dependent oxidoreductase, partial [Thermomicrobiales bacterium]|nr:FAD-dependent oxidoreductase [Thermomicrobiales bacterium]